MRLAWGKTSVKRGTVFEPFLGPWTTISFQKRNPCFDNFPNVSFIFVFSYTVFHVSTSPFCSVSLCFCCIISTCSSPFVSSPATHTHTHRKHAFLQYSEHCHTTPHHTHATRDLQSVLSKSTSVNTPKRGELRLSRAKSGKTLEKARFDRRANHSLYLGQGRRTKD